MPASGSFAVRDRAVKDGLNDPYPWPYDGDLRAENTALVVVDMQTAFCGIGGNVERMGYGLSLTAHRSNRSPPVLGTMPPRPACRTAAVGAY
jgi:hypothetical protein